MDRDRFFPIKSIFSKLAASTSTSVLLALLVMTSGAVVYYYKSTHRAHLHGGLNGVVKEGSEAPDFTLEDLDGNPVSFSALAADKKAVVLNFFATWCGPCRIELPHLADFYGRHKDSGLALLVVNVKENGAKVQAYMKKNKFTFPVVLDTAGEVSDLYGVKAIPMSFLIGPDLKVKHVHAGPRMPGTEFFSSVEGLLGIEISDSLNPEERAEKAEPEEKK